MKKLMLVFFVILSVTKIQAQNYQIAFAGTGASIAVDSVKVENLTQFTNKTLKGSDLLHLIGTVGINELNLNSNNTIRIYPNPSTGICTVGFEATTQSVATIGLYDITGKRILLVQELLTMGHHTYSLRGIRRGIYLLKVESDKYSYSAKIISSNEQSGITEIIHTGTTPGIDKQSIGSNTNMIENLKSGKSVIDMQYTSGNILKLTGFSGGIYRTIFMLVPTQSQTVTFNFVACTDADGNNYPIVQIGTQTWMAENLKTTKYNDSTNIPNVTETGAWSVLRTGAYCWFVNNAATFQNLYGALYNWYAVKNEKICPVGWHVPSDTEWKQLEIALGMTQIQADSSSRYRGTNQGTQMKNNSGWDNNGNGTNSSGFSALPGGQRSHSGDFMFSREQAVWWSSIEAADIPKAWYRYLAYDHSDVNRGYYYPSDHPSVGYSVRCVRDETCGSSLTINHVAGAVAPVTKTVTYGTVTNIPGETSKCWITSNLGASQQATAVSDATEASAGWYWQFNRKQGYKYEGTTRTPNSTWITPINENLDWQVANDPCTIELGNGWRIPTQTEWTNVDASGNWTNWNGPWTSGLKLHAAGYLNFTNGSQIYCGINGYYWSSTQSSTDGGYLRFGSGFSDMIYSYKAYGHSLRCIKDAGSSTTAPTVTTSAITGITQTTATSGGNVTSDGGATVTARGVCWGTSPNPTTANSKTTDGSGTGTFVSNLTSLTLNTPYYVRAYATNSVGTAYGNEVSFTTLSGGSACGSVITINHMAGVVAPVTKTVTYGTVTDIPGGTSKCWITSNLGASQQATAVNDATEASAGWYWQFNRKQGYKHDGTTRTPNSTWISNINESSDWTTTNDPCTIELGSGWRIPTSTEWTNVYQSDNSWTTMTGPCNSSLKIHAAGALATSNGLLGSQGSYGAYWSSMQGNAATTGWNLSFCSSYSGMYNTGLKAYGFSLRCIKDAASSTTTPTVTTTVVTGITQTTATSGGNVTSDGGATVTARGVCWSTSPNPTTTNSKTTDGSGTGTFVSSLISLTQNTPYYVRAYATNSVGTAYGNEVSFTTLPGGSTCGSAITINHVVSGGIAPVTKTVTYGTITNIPGETSKCWITSNLGASQQATAVSDATEASAGWYWQFNRKQGYKNDGTTLTPSMSTITFNENSDWTAPNDPCARELGSNWRIPTSTEWNNVITSGSWTNWNGPWNSGLKLHAAGYLLNDGGSLSSRGSQGRYASSTQNNTASGWNLQFNSAGISVFNLGKYGGFSLRCLRDAGSSTTTPAIITTLVTNITQTTATVGGNVIFDGGATVTARGVSWSTSQNPLATGNHSIEGTGTGTFTNPITALTANTLYYVRAYAINSLGTAYGNEVTFRTLSDSTCGSLTINHVVSGGVAPVAKTVTYSTITNIPGEPSKCWITSNLGADHQATVLYDATEASAGWYWQFNRKQGYKQDGITRTPNSTWITTINENIDWQVANDPCTIELGSGWRIPTSAEWANVDASGGWTDWIVLWNSGLKLHAAGRLKASDGSLQYLGASGQIWSSTQYSSTNYGMQLMYGSGDSFTSFSEKANGNSVRCLKDAGSSSTTPMVTTNVVTSITQTTATSGGNVTSDGGATVTARGICWGTSPNPTTANSKTTDGSGTGAFVSSLTSLTLNTPYYVRAYATNSVGTAYGNEVSFTTLSGSTCGSSLVINHVAGAVAPVTKSVTYATVTNIHGETSKCWITSNLGASQQAMAVDDATEASAGWYWQFNRKQGYKHDGTTRTPNSTWTTPINENLDWQATNDPCAIELGSGWRIPTQTEWTNVNTSGSWTNWNGPWNSALKIHAAGDLYYGDGNIYGRGSRGYYWSSSQDSDYGYGRNLNFSSSYSSMGPNYKATGVSLRCLKDAGSANTTPAVTTTAITSITQTTATSGGNVTSDGGATVTARGVCWSTSQNPTIAGSHTTDGSGTGVFVSSLISLTQNTPYYVRAYATNSVGTAYGNEVSFTTLSISGSSCGSSITINHVAGVVAPVTKTVTYGTVTNIPGETSKCWITSNLGADRQAMAADDATEASAGWYWQFNRKQGYKHDGTSRTPNSTWINSIIEDSEWTTTNDPCRIELGSSWHVPMSSEWANVDAIGNWTNWNGVWNSGLKLHAAGLLNFPTGELFQRGSGGFYYGSRQGNEYNAWRLEFHSYSCQTSTDLARATGMSLRCVKEGAGAFYLGQSTEGGIVFYIDGTGQHGLVCATSNVITGGTLWGCPATSISTSTVINTGQANTTAIVNGCSEANIAARICDQYSVTMDGVTYNDWFLPSKDELNLMYLQAGLIGGFGSYRYWSSSQYDANNAWSQSFLDGSQPYNHKSIPSIYVRAIRAF